MKPKILHSALAAITGELKKVRAEYDATIKEIQRINGEIKHLMDMPVNLADFGEFLKKSIQIEGEKYLANIGNELLAAPDEGKKPVNQWSLSFLDGKPLQDGRAGNGMPIRNWLLDDIYTNVSALNDYRNSHQHRQMLCCFVPDAVYNTMMAAIKKQIGEKWGSEDLPSVAERRTSIAALEAELSELEAKRGRLAEQLAEFGQITAINTELNEIQQMTDTENA